MLWNNSPDGPYRCPACDSTGFVCAYHRDRPWAELSRRADACGCGSGAPCRLCNADDPAPQLESNVVYLTGKPYFAPDTRAMRSDAYAIDEAVMASCVEYFQKGAGKAVRSFVSLPLFANPVTNIDFTKALASTLKRPALFPVPALALKVLFGEMSEVLLGSQRAPPKAAEAGGYRFRFPELGAALADVLR